MTNPINNYCENRSNTIATEATSTTSNNLILPGTIQVPEIVLKWNMYMLLGRAASIRSDNRIVLNPKLLRRKII